MSALGGKRTLRKPSTLGILEGFPHRNRQSIIVVGMRWSNVLPDWQAHRCCDREATGRVEPCSGRHPDGLAAASLFNLTRNLLTTFPLACQLDEGVPGGVPMFMVFLSVVVMVFRLLMVMFSRAEQV